jgi:hypothetical protein
MAQISFDRQTKYLGIFATAKEAALAFDQAVVQHKRPSSKLNFPNDHTSSNENDERSNSDEESDDARSDDESDGGVAVGPSPFPAFSPRAIVFPRRSHAGPSCCGCGSTNQQ